MPNPSDTSHTEDVHGLSENCKRYKIVGEGEPRKPDEGFIYISMRVRGMKREADRAGDSGREREDEGQNDV